MQQVSACLKEGDIVRRKTLWIDKIYKIKWLSSEGFSYREGVIRWNGDLEDYNVYRKEEWTILYQPIKGGKRMEVKDVNPENIQVGDFISTKNGIACVLWVDEDRGCLTYEPLNRAYKEEGVPIRSVRLIAKRRNEGQLTLSFVEQEIEQAIEERNLRLEKLLKEAQEKGKYKKIQKGKRKEDVPLEIALLLEKVSIEKILQTLQEIKKEGK